MKEEPAEFLIQSMQTSNELNIKEEPADFLIQSLQTSDEEFDMNETSTKMNQKNKKNSNSFVRDGYQTIPEDVLEKLEKFEEITPLGFRYVKIIYNDIGLYLCDICNKTAPTKGSMRNHKQNHKRFDVTVDNYEIGMETKYEIKGFTIPEDEFEKLEKVEEITPLGFRYIKVIYENEEVYVCEKCRLTKPTKIGISNHMRHYGHFHKVAAMKKEVNTATKDNGDGSFSCKICGKSFPSEHACRGHMSWHKSKGKTIKRFGSLSGVNGHMTAHSRKGEYVSKESLKSKNSLNSGEDRITRSTDKVDEQNQFFFIRKELGENIYFCNFCDKNFTSKTGVLYHASRQHGDKQLVDNSAHDNTIFR